jgi:hypothetical protein
MRISGMGGGSSAIPAICLHLIAAVHEWPLRLLSNECSVPKGDVGGVGKRTHNVKLTGAREGASTK